MIRLFSLSAIALLGYGTSLAAWPSSSVITPISLSEFNPCAMGGAGEWVDLSGTVHYVGHFTETKSGNTNLKLHFQQRVTGTGRTSGTTYQGHGVTLITENIKAPLPFSSTYIGSFLMIGQGPGNNLMVHRNYHVTVNTDGTVTADHDNTWVSCR